MAKTSLQKKDVEHLAKLASLTLSDPEIEKYLSQFDETLKYVENMAELDTSKVQETSHAVAVENVFFEDGAKNERGLTHEELQYNAKVTDSNALQVSRILE